MIKKPRFIKNMRFLSAIDDENHRGLNFLMKRKGQIAETITWFGAFFAILIVMILFVIFSSAIALNKTIQTGNARSIEAGAQDYSIASIEGHRSLNNFMNSKLDGVKLYQIFWLDETSISGHKQELDEKAGLFFQRYPSWNLQINEDGKEVYKTSMGEGCTLSGDVIVVQINEKKKATFCFTLEGIHDE